MRMAPPMIPQFTDELSLAGCGFVVLGAGGSVGEQTAHGLAQLGAEVLCVDVDPKRANAVARAINGCSLSMDVTNRGEMIRLFEEADNILDEPVRGVVDLVGAPLDCPLQDMDDDAWKRQLDLVFSHAHLAIQYGAPRIAANGGGSMVFMGSAPGLRARPGAFLPYSVAGAALNHLIRGAAQEWAPSKVRMNVVAPGITRSLRPAEEKNAKGWIAQSSTVPLGRAAETADVAASILYFCSGWSSHLTGNVLPVDGGDLGMVEPAPAAQVAAVDR
jgi:NAD(P)-dependent dehydrogenase (short-subunit alcohol dehydrogenase family)